MKENNDIFLAGDDALVYLTDPFSTYVPFDQFFKPHHQ